jgi:hypothetical protein
MEDSSISAVASRVLESVHRSSAERPDARGGEPRWYYDLCSRIAAVIGDDEVLYVSHTFTDEVEQDGVLWLFTPHLVVTGTAKGNDRDCEVVVTTFGRRTLRELEVLEFSDAFGKQGQYWPARMRLRLAYEADRSVTLPAEPHSLALNDLATLLPGLARDLNLA